MIDQETIQRHYITTVERCLSAVDEMQTALNASDEELFKQHNAVAQRLGYLASTLSYSVRPLNQQTYAPEACLRSSHAVAS